MAGGSSEVRTISDEEWQSKRDQVNVSKEHLNMLVLNFLQTEVRPTLIDTGPGLAMLAPRACGSKRMAGVLSQTMSGTLWTPDQAISVSWLNNICCMHVSQPSTNCKWMLQGFEDAAQAFQEETGTRGVCQAAAPERASVRSSIEQGDVMAAVEQVNDINPEVCNMFATPAFEHVPAE